MNQMLHILKDKVLNLHNTGIEKEKDESKQKYILVTNLLALFTSIVVFLSGIALFVFTKEDWAAYMNFVASFLLLISVYFNAKGYTLAAKVSMPLIGNCSVFISCIVFSHDARLENYLLIILITCAFLFTYEERRWMYAVIIITLTNYIIESTTLRNYFPSYNLSRDIEKTKFILFLSYIFVSLADVLAFIHIIWLREKHLMKKQRDLESAQNTLQVQNEDLQTFSIAASHSLQTPIHVSKFFLNKVRKNHKDSHVITSTQKNLDIIEDSINQMDQLVSGLFSYARIINIEDYYEPCNIHNELQIIKKRMEEKFLNCLIIIPETPVYITTNKMLFSIIIQNLIDNGLKYNNSPRPAIELRVEKKENTVSFFIKDNGIGIEREYFDNIFEPFKRIQRTNEFKGTGLGLSGAKRAAERIGGKIFCKQSSESGTVFQLDLPVIAEKKERIFQKAQTGRQFSRTDD